MFTNFSEFGGTNKNWSKFTIIGEWSNFFFQDGDKFEDLRVHLAEVYSEQKEKGYVLVRFREDLFL